MTEILGLYMAPDGFHIVDTAGGMTFHVRDDAIYYNRHATTIPEDEYLVARELIGKEVSGILQAYNNPVIIIGGDNYCFEFNSTQQQRLFKRQSDGQIMAIGLPEWSYEQMIAQKHGLITVFTVHCTALDMEKLKPTIFMRNEGSYVSGDINSRERVLEYEFLVTMPQLQICSKLLSENGVLILKQKVFRPQFKNYLNHCFCYSKVAKI